MTTTRDEVKRLLIWDALGALAVGLIAGYFNGDYVYALAIGFAMVYMVEVFYFLTKHLLRPRNDDRRAVGDGIYGTLSRILVRLGGPK
jgi:hypothetical protein